MVKCAFLVCVALVLPPAATAGPDDNEAGLAEPLRERSIAETVSGPVLVRDIEERLLAARPETHSASFIRTLVEGHVVTEALLAEAEKRGLHREPDFLQLRKTMVEREMLSAFISDEIDRKARVSDEEKRAYYESHLGDFVEPAARRVWFVFMAAPQDEPEARRLEARERIEKVRGMVLGGADLAETAREHSESPSAAHGGDAGWVPRGKYNPRFEEAAHTTPIGEISVVFETRHGYYFLSPREERPAQQKTFEESLIQIANDYTRYESRRRIDRRREELLAELRNRLHSEEHYDLLREEAADPESVAAAVGDVTVTVGEYRRRVEARAWSTTRDPEEQMRGFRNWFEGVLLLQGARAAGYERHPNVVREEQLLRREHLIARLTSLEAERVGESLPAPGEEELRAYYERHPEEFSLPEMKHVHEIIIDADIPADATPPTRHYAMEAARKKILAIRGRALSGEEFSELARQHSDSVTAAEGGDLGLRPEARLISFRRQAYQLEPGEISSPVETENGYALFRVEAIQAARILGFDEAREQVAQKLHRRKISDAMWEYRRQVLADAKIRFDEQTIAAVLESLVTGPRQ